MTTALWMWEIRFCDPTFHRPQKAAGESNSPAAFSRFPLLKHILHIGDTVFFGTKSAYLQSPQGRLFAAEKGGDAQ